MTLIGLLGAVQNGSLAGNTFFDGVEERDDNGMQYGGAGAGRRICEVLELKERAEPAAEL